MLRRLDGLDTHGLVSPSYHRQRRGYDFPSQAVFRERFAAAQCHLKVSGASRHELGMQAEELS